MLIKLPWMKKYEKNLLKILEQTKNGTKPIHQKASDLSTEQLKFLSAKGLIRLHAAGDNLFFISVEPAGLTYFEDKKEKRADFLKTYFASYAASFLAGLTSGVLLTLLTTKFLA